MELRQLRYFVAVVDCGGVSHAARVLNVAQPAVSRQIKSLENELGFDLFVRVGRRVVLTDTGRVFAERARSILDEVTQAVLETRRIADGEAGIIRVGFRDSASWGGPVPIILNRFKRKYRNIRLDIRSMESTAQIVALQAGELDAGFFYRQSTVDDDALSVLSVRKDDVLFAASTELAFDHEGPLSISDIEGLPLVALPRATAPVYHDRLLSALNALGFEAQIAQEARDEAIALGLVSAGVGCAFVNAANLYRPPKGVQFRRIVGLSVPLELLFATRQPPGPLPQKLATLVKDVNAELASE